MRYQDFQAAPAAANGQNNSQAARTRDCTVMIMQAMARYLRTEDEDLQAFVTPMQQHRQAA
ncbi:MAG: hypothetical protein AAF362_03850 [Pseudomonadota bacterium]